MVSLVDELSGGDLIGAALDEMDALEKENARLRERVEELEEVISNGIATTKKVRELLHDWSPLAEEILVTLKEPADADQK